MYTSEEIKYVCETCNSIFKSHNPNILCKKCKKTVVPFNKIFFPSLIASDLNNSGSILKAYKTAIADKISFGRQMGYTKLNINIVTGYFDFEAWNLMKESLISATGNIKILIGSLPNIYDKKPIKSQINKDFRETLKSDINKIKITDIGKREIIKEFSKWLEQDNVEIKIYEEDFLHAKSFHAFYEEDLDVNSLFVGSANFTRAGLVSNKEAMVAINKRSVAKEAKDWFESLWRKSKIINEYNIVYSNISDGFTHRQIYANMLDVVFKDLSISHDEYYGGYNERWLSGLSEFQKDAAIQAYIMLQGDKHNGVLLTDEVGLGKTYIAGSIIKKYYDMGARSIIISPASIRDNVWKKYLEKNDIDTSRVKSISFNEAREIEKQGFDLADYSLLIVDEAHYIKDSKTVTYQRIQEEIMPLMSNAKVLLLTATPINNSIMDLYNLLKLYVVDNQIIGIDSLFEQFNKSNKEDPSTHNWEWIEVLLKEVSIHRTRQSIKNKYKEITLNGEPANFPKINDTKIINYSLTEKHKNLFNMVLDDLENNLTFATYRYKNYIDKNLLEPYAVSLVKISILKAADSSFESFLSLVTNMIDRIDNNLLELNTANLNKQEMHGYDFSEELNYETDDKEDDELGEKTSKKNIVENVSFSTEAVHSFIGDLNKDRKILDAWIQDIKSIETDPKIEALYSEIEKIESTFNGTNISDYNNRKMVIFTSSKITAKYIYRELDKRINRNHNSKYYDIKNRIGIVTGDNKNQRSSILKSFAPMSMNDEHKKLDKGELDIIVTTDVLAEGVNLQQVPRIINYDMPWNPMRLVQRLGRIDRLHSQHEIIDNYCMFMDDDSELIFRKILRINEILEYKMLLARNIMGHKDVTGLLKNVDEIPEKIREFNDIDNANIKNILNQSKNIENFKKEIELIRQGQPITTALQTHDLSFLEDWKDEFLKNNNIIVPFGSGSIFKSKFVLNPTWIICYEINAWHEILKTRIKITRFVTYDHNTNYDSWNAIQLAKPNDLYNDYYNSAPSQEQIDSAFLQLPSFISTISKDMIKNNKEHNEKIKNSLSPSSPDIKIIKGKILEYISQFEEESQEAIKPFLKGAALEHHFKHIERIIKNNSEEPKKVEQRIVNYIIHRNLNVDRFSQIIHFNEEDIKVKYWLHIIPE